MNTASIENSVNFETWELEILDLFVGIFDTFGFPKSTAMIYGVLYCSDEDLLQEEIGRRLGISVGSASQGLKVLTTIGAVHRLSQPGQRQSAYSPERSMRRLLAYFIDAQMRPRLNAGQEKLKTIEENIPADNLNARQKVRTLIEWQRKADKALPIISTLFGK